MLNINKWSEKLTLILIFEMIIGILFLYFMKSAVQAMIFIIFFYPPVGFGFLLKKSNF